MNIFIWSWKYLSEASQFHGISKHNQKGNLAGLLSGLKGIKVVLYLILCALY